MILKESQKKQLRRLGHNLHPIVMIAGKGITENIDKEISAGLDHHELIKVKILAETRESRTEIIQSICDSHKCHLIQRVGNIALLFKRNPQKPKIEFEK